MAYFALFGWSVIVIFLFRRLDLQWAAVIAIFGGYLLLPSQNEIFIDLPVLPSFDKRSLPALTAIIMTMIMIQARPRSVARDSQNRTQEQVEEIKVWRPGWMPRTVIGVVLLIGLLGGAFMTVLTNTDLLVFGATVLPGQRPYDAFSIALTSLVTILPLLLGRKLLSDEKGHRVVLIAFALAAMIYSLPTLYEVRMSPQLNRIVYGFFPHSWIQHVRGDGFRPLVFLNHGLHLAIFNACGLLAVICLIRATSGRLRIIFFVCSLWMAMTLYLSNSLGALIIALLLAPAAFLVPVRLQLLTAALIAGTVLFYPALRTAELVPTEEISEFFTEMDERRGQSLSFRFHHEDLLLAKANERPLFGWSGFGRARIYDETGRDITTADGEWVITMAVSGWVGYTSIFGLLCIPTMLFLFRKKRYKVDIATSSLCLILAANLVDLIPNSGLSPVSWMVAGALLGRLETKIAKAPRTVRSASRHSRFEHRHTRS